MSAVIAYEVVRRIRVAAEVRDAAAKAEPAAAMGGGAIPSRCPHEHVARDRDAKRGQAEWAALAAAVVAGTAALVLAVFATLAFVRAVTGANDLTSSGTFGAALRLAVPIGLAALGGLYAERAGVVNIGLEGMMILGTWFGAWAGWQWGPWAGVAVRNHRRRARRRCCTRSATVTFGVDHVVSGVAINIMALGVTRYLAIRGVHGTTGRVRHACRRRSNGTVGRFTVPFLAGGDLFGWETPDFFGALEKQHWFFVSDLAGVVKGLTSNLSWLTSSRCCSCRSAPICSGTRRSGCDSARLARPRPRPTRSAYPCTR